MPVAVGRTTTARVRFCVPPPHALEQLPQSPHAAVEQLYTQGVGTHARVSFSVGHEVPLRRGASSTVRLRLCTPAVAALVPLQLVVHSPHSLHGDAVQLRLQLAVTHVSQLAPYGMKGLQHVAHTCAEQPPGGTEGEHSLPQGAAPHGAVSFTAGHALPPFTASATTARVRTLLWPLQLRGQSLHGAHADTVHARGVAQSSVTHLSHR